MHYHVKVVIFNDFQKVNRVGALQVSEGMLFHQVGTTTEEGMTPEGSGYAAEPVN